MQIFQVHDGCVVEVILVARLELSSGVSEIWSCGQVSVKDAVSLRYVYSDSQCQVRLLLKSSEHTWAGTQAGYMATRHIDPRSM